MFYDIIISLLGKGVDYFSLTEAGIDFGKALIKR
jgi:hypothetical protein